ncbi:MULTISPECIES: helix-turn-helix transcriptional regulator [unclassified Arthrobacter]|uniref:helix-turn-helix transcriptional regulator n=1 Tax=unclassified Arthrobacter TaxID=235627 RepID=UPI001D13E624|nr:MULTISPECIES: WYL domain-containing protein [unclassified Arthrobacter]MCC3274776.1 WYL domain-containing protein [Arthrobacter sp. zg-Y20]MCC9177631.1 WYL domain-containing protein [Arthrobacter sp. zg-Y750]MDK1314932.1 WYL domain-containing protein [Arthrobacter sp. zg.Y20]WIB04787.1 WYL domain-containing protein [Arthrobacter sp. zg-Y20]
MSAKRTERLLNLVIALLSTRRGFTKHELFEEIELYGEAATPEAREKLFDRDKAFLREQGIPVESASEEYEDNTVQRYRIRHDAYRLPGVQFTPEESAVLALAARMWDQASLGSAAARALRKLQARGVLPDDAGRIPLQPSIRTNDPYFDDIWRAATTRVPVTFSYRASGSDTVSVRRVQPWGMGSRFGHWYLVGYDLDRRAERIFRLSRMQAPVRLRPGSYTVPEDFDIDASLASLDDVFTVRPAEVELLPGTGTALRLQAQSVVPGTGGRDRLLLQVRDLDSLAADTAALGAAAVAVDPPEYVDAVRNALTGALEAQRRPLPEFTLAEQSAPARRPGYGAQDHLTRLLDLVPYVLANQGADMDETAAAFGVSKEQLAKDLDLLFVSGPRHYPNGLMDVSFDDDRIYIENADNLSEPVRFGMDEAAALIVGLDTLSALPGIGSSAAVAGAVGKLTEAAGEAGAVGTAVAARLDDTAGADVLVELQQAIAGARQLELRYLVPRRDEVTLRTVDPRRLFSVDNIWYVEAWCHRAEALRNFRVDRILGVRDTGPALTHAPETDASFPDSLFTPGPQDTLVTLVLDPASLWVAEAYDAERRAALPDGRTAVELRTADAAWIPSFMGRLGGGAAVAAPAELREAAQSWLEEAAGNYPAG